MGFASFDAFCGALCELIGIPAPSLVPDGNGRVSFSVEHAGATVGFARDDRGTGPGVLMVLELDAPPEGIELEVLRALMSINLAELGVGAPQFARNDTTGCISVCHALPLDQLDLQAVYGSVIHAASTLRAWHEHHFLERFVPASVQNVPVDMMALA